jgi:glycosyltransferase involved in cell wall biosynthesis
MKIALLGPSHPFRGGIVHFNSRLARELQERRDLPVDLLYWSRIYPGFLLRESTRSRLDEKSTETFHRQGLRMLSCTNPLTWLSLIRHVRRGRYDLFVTHWVHPVHFPVFLVVFAALRLLTRTRITLLVHNCRPHERFPGDAFLGRSIMSMAHRVIVHGRAEACLAQDMGVRPGKLATAFHPVSDLFAAPGDSGASLRRELGLKKKVLLFFGFIRPYKGLDILLEAFRTLARKDPDVSLLIAGESFYVRPGEAGDRNRFFRELASDDPVRSQIVWIDRYIPNQEVGRYFAAADAFVAPYRSVTQSGPLNIAYAFDKPVIASDLPAFRDCVGVGESGYLFEPSNAAALARTIERFFEKPVSPQSVRRYRQRFGWDRYVEILVETGSCLEKGAI